MELDRISFDGRTPINRLRRRQLYDVAKRLGIVHPQDIPAEQMVKILEANNVDVRSPAAGLQWLQIRGQDEHGRDHVELEPVVPRPPPKNIDYDSEIEKRIADSKAKTAEVDSENEALKIRIAALEKLIVNPGITLAYDKCMPWMLQHAMKDRGLPFTKGMTKEAMIEALTAHDANPFGATHENAAPGSQ